ncbi:HD domain-containing protein [Sulfuracidifex metallicus]|uniref:HD domain-containing protein n=1 Tax=Sulfuracidifex metallicus TaxID=47303 RepID=UPI0022767854|nr:HD domain-containing protein [Sulfuracidifex metallicus]MCY0849669.1 HD domain-containing protein [Sulfuracidifex metallicus]
MKLVRDPVHGYIELDERVLRLVSDPFFQRLRHVTQTGLAYMVYPGMTHKRFEHSLGTMYLAKEFSSFIKRNSEVDFLTTEMISLISIAGLLHDIGHMPFSHTFENVLTTLRQVYGEEVIEQGKKTHVIMGEKIISEELSSVLEKEFSFAGVDPVKFIINVISGKYNTEEEKLGSLLISSFIDSDRSDYLLRDSYFAGVDYGRFDIERLKRVMLYVDGNLAILKKATPIVEEFLLARMYMYENVYFHSVVGMYNAIATHGIAKLIRENIIEVPLQPKELLKLNEFNIMYELQKHGEEFYIGLMERKGFRRIKQDITQECTNINEIRDEAMKESFDTNGLIMYHDFFDVPYMEDLGEAIYIYDGKEIERFSSVSTMVKSMKELRKAIVAYHVKVKDRIDKLERMIKKCK